MKKVIITVVTLLLFTLMMTGCALGGKKRTPANEDTTTDTKQEDTVQEDTVQEDSVEEQEDAADATTTEEASAEEDTADGEVDTTYLSYIDKIEIGDSLDTINKALGCEGVQNPNSLKTYEWTFERGGMSVVFKEESGDSAISIDLEYESKDIINDDAKIENLDELKEKVSNGITYDEFVEFLGGVEGVKDGKSSVTVDYSWKNSDGAWIGAGFRTEDNMCNSFVGAGR